MRWLLATILALGLSCASASAWASGQGQDPHLTAISDLELSGPVSKPAAAYLGLPEGEGGFRLSQVKADFLLVEVFSMYCPYCQAEARNVNALFGLLQKSKAAGKMKLLGIGAGNTPFEVDFFRDKYQVPFPLFPDQDFVCHKALNGPGTPYFMLLKPDGAGGFTVLHSHLGAIGDPGQFLDVLLRKAGLR
ncbi:MAG: TlpA disulfide reductase family protein [Thermodesulfobacteriota bacterium]